MRYLDCEGLDEAELSVWTAVFIETASTEEADAEVRAMRLHFENTEKESVIAQAAVMEIEREAAVRAAEAPIREAKAKETAAQKAERRRQAKAQAALGEELAREIGFRS